MKSKKGGAATSATNTNSNIFSPIDINHTLDSLNNKDPVDNTGSVDKIVNIFITYIDEYNKNVDSENLELINQIKIEKKAKQSTYIHQGGTKDAELTENAKNKRIDDLIISGDIAEVFKLIRRKTALYWYDYVKLDNLEEQTNIFKKLLNFLFKKRIKNQIVPDINYSYAENEIKTLNNGGHVFTIKDDANLQTLYYIDNYTPKYRFVFNNHPFSSIKLSLSEESEIVIEKYINENDYVWFIEKNNVSIYKNYSICELKCIINNKLTDWFGSDAISKKDKLEKIKIMMNLHPQFFYINYINSVYTEREWFNAFYSNFTKVMSQNSKPVFIQQGAHSLCCLCTILNAIYYFYKFSPRVESRLIESDIQESCKNLINELLDNFSVLEFIKNFKINTPSRVESILDITSRGDYAKNILPQILTNEGINKMISKIKVGYKNYNIIPFIEWKTHIVFCVYDEIYYDESRSSCQSTISINLSETSDGSESSIPCNFLIYDSNTPYVKNIYTYFSEVSEKKGQYLSLIHKINDKLNTESIEIDSIDTLIKYFNPSNNNLTGGNSMIKRYLKQLYKCPDGRLRKAFRIQGNGNTIFVICKKNIVKAKSIPKSRKSLV